MAAHVMRGADDHESAGVVLAMPQVHAAQQPAASVNALLRCLRQAGGACSAPHSVAAALDGLAQDMDQVGEKTAVHAHI